MVVVVSIDASVHLDPHLAWQAIKNDVERSNAFDFVSHQDLSPYMLIRGAGPLRGTRRRVTARPRQRLPLAL